MPIRLGRREVTTMVDAHPPRDIAAQDPIVDPVSPDSTANREIGFQVPRVYNASDILFQHLNTSSSENVAVIDDFGTTTYRQLCEYAAQTGNGLQSLGLAIGTRVLLFLDDTAAYPAILFGAIRAGYVPVLINTLSTPELLHFYLKDSAAKVAFYDADYAALFTDDALRDTNLDFCFAVDYSGATISEATSTWQEWCESFSVELDAVASHRDDMAFWMYSSGSTGRPKGIVHLQHDMLFSAESFGRHILNITPDDICFSVPKIFFAYGLGNSVYFPFYVGAKTVLLKGRPTADSVFGTIEVHQPTLLFGLPTLYNSLMRSERRLSADLSSVRLCLSAAETLSSDLFARWHQLFGHEIIEGLGSTEMTHVYLSNRPGNFRVGSAGQRVPGYDLKLTDNDGVLVEDGEEGVLWVRGDSSSPCYWNRPEKTVETMRGDWIYTGDRFSKDHDGFYYFRGRADDLIKVSGQWVYPLEVELCLSEHPSVAECAVLGVETADRLTVLQAFVVLKALQVNHSQMTKDLQAFAKTRLVPFKYPRFIHYLDALPKTGTDKIDRQALLKSVQPSDSADASY